MAQPFEGASRFHRAVRTFGGTAVGSKLLAPVANRLDNAVLRVTGGRRTAFELLTGLRPMQLTTTGAKSGQLRRANVLGLPHPDGFGLLASNFGRARHPAWFVNLLAHPQATIQVRGDVRHVTARLATAEEREELWSEGLALAPGWRNYVDRTQGREIQAVVLTLRDNQEPPRQQRRS